MWRFFLISNINSPCYKLIYLIHVLSFAGMKRLDHHLLCKNLLCIWSLLSLFLPHSSLFQTKQMNSFILALEVMFSKLLIIWIIYDKLSSVSVFFRKIVPSHKSAQQYQVAWNKHILNLTRDMLLITFWNYICVFYKWTFTCICVPNLFPAFAKAVLAHFLFM